MKITVRNLSLISMIMLVLAMSLFASALVVDARPSSQLPMNVTDILKYVFDSVFMAEFLSMLGLILLDWLFGVSLAIRAGKFDFKQLADFYRSSVMPKLVGWLALSVVLKLGAFFALGDLQSAIPLSVAGLAYTIIFVSLVADVATKAKDLFGADVVVPPTPPAPTK